MNIRPQVLTAMIALFAIGMTTMLVVPEHTEVIVSSVVTGLVGLGMQLLKS